MIVTWIFEGRKEKHIPWLKDMEVEITLDALDVAFIKRNILTSSSVKVQGEDLFLTHKRKKDSKLPPKETIKGVVKSIAIKMEK